MKMKIDDVGFNLKRVFDCLYNECYQQISIKRKICEYLKIKEKKDRIIINEIDFEKNQLFFRYRTRNIDSSIRSDIEQPDSAEIERSLCL